MSKIVYTLSNSRNQDIGLGSVGILPANQQRAFTVEEDSPDETFLGQVISQGLVSLVSAVPAQSAYGPANLTTTQVTGIQALVSGGWNPPPVALWGDSYTKYNNYGDSTTYKSAGAEGYFNVANALAGNRMRVVAYAGVGGDTMPMMLARFDSQVKPYITAGGFVSIVAGANDLYVSGDSLATMTNNLSTMLQKVRDLGATPILSTLWAHSYSGNRATLIQHLAYRDWILNEQFRSNVKVWDGYLVAQDPTSTDGVPRSGFNDDSGSGNHHPNIAGALYYGLALSPLIQSLCRPVKFLPTSAEDLTNTGGALAVSSNRLTNPAMIGTGGTNTTGGTGTPPTGYALTRTATGSVNVTMADYLDPDTGLAIGKYVEMACTAAAANDEFLLTNSVTPNSSIDVAGAVYQGECGMQLISPVNVTRAAYRVSLDSGAGEQTWFNPKDQAAAATYPLGFLMPMTQTRPMATLGAVLTLKWEARIKFSAAGTATFRVWLPRLRKVS
jgi:hypothetical protein